MPLVPPRFLFRLSYPCFQAVMPVSGDDQAVCLGEEYRIDNFAEMDERNNFADFRMAWNELGIGLQVEVRGKQKPAQGNPARPRVSDGVTIWIDTRDARAAHRATRYCHQFHFLASGAGPDHDDPICVQTKINRALEDAPMATLTSIVYVLQSTRGGYRLEAFLPVSALNGFDPEQYPRLGFFYAVHDDELGEQLLSLNAEFPYWEDPSLWSVLDLVR